MPARRRERVLRRQPVLEVGEQFGELRREVVGHHLAAVALQREGGDAVGPGSPADREIDAVREQPGEEAEALRHLERAVVREHHAAAADTDGGGRRGDRTDQHLRAGTGEHRAAVVLGDPVAVVAERVGGDREIDRVAQRLGAGRALRHRRLVEHAEGEGGAHRLSLDTLPGALRDPATDAAKCDGYRGARRTMRAVRRLFERFAARVALAATLAAAWAGAAVLAHAAVAPALLLTYISGYGTSHPMVVVSQVDGAVPRALVPASSALLSPDGTEVAVISPSSSTLSVYGSAGGDPQVLVRNSTSFMQLLAWSPDSKLLLVAVGRTRGQLMVFDVTTGASTPVANGVFEGASFEPGGTDDIVYSLANANGAFNLFITTPTGTPTRQLTHDDRSEFPVWGRTGIVYSRLMPAAEGRHADPAAVADPPRRRGHAPADRHHQRAREVHGPDADRILGQRRAPARQPRRPEPQLVRGLRARPQPPAKHAPRSHRADNGTTIGDAISGNGELVLATKGSLSDQAALSIEEIQLGRRQADRARQERRYAELEPAERRRGAQASGQRPGAVEDAPRPLLGVARARRPRRRRGRASRSASSRCRRRSGAEPPTSEVGVPNAIAIDAGEHGERGDPVTREAQQRREPRGRGGHRADASRGARRARGARARAGPLRTWGRERFGSCDAMPRGYTRAAAGRARAQPSAEKSRPSRRRRA